VALQVFGHVGEVFGLCGGGELVLVSVDVGREATYEGAEEEMVVVCH
jgi:hypothetical protein